ncbi:hypothetical protein B0H17DRAFT_1334059 [Mycena rosella]|uniref:Uncharacterized protein n=1 Tax=Mycena rosella TaxID=1033263 RepID=A0AAD7D4P2_MYCRO|nr:hypothetical protein B0H17DRAFT_1334059 [Mycena rosella]
MDPITAVTTIITLATFIKDLIDVGQSIKRSIDQVRDNRRRIRDLTDDILSTLAKLADLSRMNEDTFQAPAQLSALGDLKADMLNVLLICTKISPVERRPGFRGIGSQIKVWIKRDDVEAEIRRLKKHVNKCYLQFTAFSAARIEQTTARVEETADRTENTTLRVEHRLIVNHVENQITLRRFEGLMARVLLETPFGQNVMNQTIGILESDTTHQTVEFQYLSTEALHLVDSLQQRTFVLDKPPWDGTGLVLPLSESPRHILYRILGVLVQINDYPRELSFTTVLDGVLHLGNSFSRLGMYSEATTWYLMIIRILHRLTGGVFNSRVLANLASSSINLSEGYQDQLRWDLATETSQQAMELCRLWQENSPDLDHSALLATILITHSRNLCATGQPEAAIPIAEEAVVVCREMAGKLLECDCETCSWSDEDEYNAGKFSQAFFVLARALSITGRHLEAYDASRDGFQAVLRFSGRIYAPRGDDIDASVDQICKAAEEGGFALAMLADSVILFRDLYRIYPGIFSSQFLRLLHAHAYFLQQSSPDFRNLRLFLEPDSSSPPPVLNTSSDFIDDLIQCGGIIEDAIQAFYIRPLDQVFPLITSFFITHFDQAISALREVTSKSMHPSSYTVLEWVLDDISSELLPVVTPAQQSVLLEITTNVVGDVRPVARNASSHSTRELFLDMLWCLFWEFWVLGLLSDAKSICDEALECLRGSPSKPDDEHLARLRRWSVRRTFVLCDMAHIPEAIEAAQDAKTVFMEGTGGVAVLNYCMVRQQILQRTGRSREAKALLGNLAFEKTDDNADIRCYPRILLADLATVRGQVGQLEKALGDAERAVSACRGDVDDGDVKGFIKHALIHALTTLSNCLAAVGRDGEALAAAEEATSIYTLGAPHMWKDFMFSLRRQELGANTFHSLSLRLVTSGKLEEALSNVEKATELYRECVLLAPRHLPTLATSLQHLGSMHGSVGNLAESTSACAEAVSILRNVADTETYFLPALAGALDQLAGYYSERGDAEAASKTTSEIIEVRKRIELLSPQPDFLFSEIEMDSDEGAGETATESEDNSVAASADLLSSQQTFSPAKLSQPCAILIQGDTQEEHAGRETVNPVQARVASILRTPLEVRLSSTPMDILWWMLVAILGVALAESWSRAP